MDQATNPNDKVIGIIFNEDDITWQSIIYELVKSEEMDPWDIDVSLITKRYVETLKQLTNMDFRVSGKIVLASALLVKIKSNRLIEEDISILDQIIASTNETDILDEETLDYLETAYETELAKEIQEAQPKAFPKTPQPRQRAVSIYDLVNALEKALEVKARRKITIAGEKMQDIHIPELKKDITAMMQDIYEEISSFYKVQQPEQLTFSQLLPSEERNDKILTFMPLLHLTTQRKIDMAQPEHFGEIFISMANLETPKTE